MPSRNLEKIFIPQAFYHVYNRGVEKRDIFLDDDDYAVFLNLLKRYLSNKPAKDTKGREYEWLYPDLELLAFCLMPNHFHLLLYQNNAAAITRLMRGVCTAYTMYFNRKYKRVGTLFQDRFKASHIQDDAYLQHISRYIHLNPQDFENWSYSSLSYYLGNKSASWVRPTKILELFEGDSYLNFVRDYTEYKRSLDELKHQLANQ